MKNDARSQFAWRSRLHGMTLIEILVTLVVLSVGLLGLAALQLKGLQVNQGSIYRWQASILAEDMADRIRADHAGALAGNYTLANGATPTVTTAGAFAAMSDWVNRVATLPGGTGAIAAPAGANANVVVITVTWVDVRAQAGTGIAAPATKTDALALSVEL